MSKVSIKNFKSIKHLEFNSRKFNIFIGEPNTGKSNILEAIGLFSIKHLIKYLLKLKLEKQEIKELKSIGHRIKDRLKEWEMKRELKDKLKFFNKI
jgi:AAA15 family ATPase/GTPase